MESRAIRVSKVESAYYYGMPVTLILRIYFYSPILRIKLRVFLRILHQQTGDYLDYLGKKMFT